MISKRKAAVRVRREKKQQKDFEILVVSIRDLGMILKEHMENSDQIHRALFDGVGP